MARPEDATPRAQRLIPLVAVGALAFATALAFGRVFVGRVPTLKLIAAGLLAVAIAWATGRRGLLVATLSSVAGLIVALTWLVYPQTAWYGLPTLRTLRAIGRSLEFVGQQTRTQVAPAWPLPPLMLAAVTAAWAASWSTCTLAVRAGSPLLAVLPPVALMAFADIVLEDGVRPVYAALFLLSALGVVFSDGLRRIRQWGPVWHGPYRDRGVRAATGRGARRVALIAVAAALLVPGLLPGFRSEALVDFASAGGSAVRIDPFVSIHASLNRESPADVLWVSVEEGAYWRVVALDSFDGSAWTMSDPSLADAVSYPTPAQLPAVFPVDAGVLMQRFEVLTDLSDRWVAMAYPAESLTLPVDGVRYDEMLGVAQAPEPLEEGDRYSVTSRRIQPTPKQLDAVTFGPSDEWGPWTALPDDLPPSVGALARAWTEGEPTPYRQVLAIQQELHDPSFRYDQTVEPEADSQALVRFLTETKAGFCQQFSTAMAVLVRELGYPARVAIGYRQGEPRDDGFLVSTDDAHSWVEVFFPGYGWLPFEPTPGRSNPLGEPGTYLNPRVPASDGPTGPVEGQDALPDGDARRLPPKIRQVEFGTDIRGGGGQLPEIPNPVPLPAATDEGGYTIPYQLLLELLLGALIVLALVVPLVKWIWRYRMLHRRREPREAVLAAYRVFDGEAADLGLARREGETLVEYTARIRGGIRFSDGHLETLTVAAMRAAYSPAAITTRDADGARRAASIAISDIRRSAGPFRRVTGIYRPGF